MNMRPRPTRWLLPLRMALSFRAALLLLTGGDDRLGAISPRRFGRAWATFMALSLGWGIVAAWLWHAAWAVFGDHSGVYLMHTAVILSVMALWLYRRGLLALGRAAGGNDAGAAGMAAAVILVVLALAMSGLRRAQDPDFVGALPDAWRWICPTVAQRVLILAPIWGGWAMLVTCQFCKPVERTERQVKSFARGCDPLAAAVCMGVALAATLLYFHFLDWAWRLTIAGVTVFAAICGGVVLVRREGGLRRSALLAVNVLTQIAFVLAFLASRHMNSRA